MGWIIALLVIVFVLAVAGAVIFVRARKIFREDKNYERGLKMVPLLIHLPPSSDDTDVGGRDVRDVNEENISKAQVLYNIIASTAQKGFRAKFYGQRHVGFEIVASKGFVYFYAAVPVSLVSVVEQAVISAYPAARLEEVAEHNIFSPVGRISGTIGGELTLKENFAYPIATYQDLKRDAMQSILNALSTLEKEDGAGIQILFRPASSDWRKKANGVANKKRKGKDKKKSGAAGVLSFTRQMATALNKPPDEKNDKGPDKPLSSLEQSIVDAIEDKTRQPGFEVLIRVVASSNISQRAEAIKNNIVATFSLFDAPGKNGFKYSAAKDIESFVTAYILRFFPAEQHNNILNSVELASMFHFPDQRNIPTSQLERQASKQVDGPRNISDEGLLLGYNVFRGSKKRINLSTNDRRRHLYIVGQTGTGKSTFMENLALQDMLNGEGFAFIDPHGDTAEKLLAMVPKERTEDVIYFSPADMEYPLGLNLFEFHSPEQKDFLIQEAINMLYKLYDPQHQGIIGPRYEHWFRNAALTLMSDPGGSTFIDIPKVFTDNKYAKQKLQHVTDQTVLDFWNKEMASTSDYHKSEVLGWFVSKFGAFLSNEMMRNIIGQTSSSFDLREIMDKKKILLVNLAKGRVGELNSKLLGMVFVMKFQAAAMSRANVPEDQRTDFSLYVDEFQNFSTDSFATILSEARKYHLNLIVANQFMTQLTEEIRDAVIGNVGSIVSFRVGTTDAEFLVKQFQPTFDIDDLQKIPNYNAIVKLMIGGVPSQAFSMATLPPLGTPNPKLGDALRQLSAAKHGRARGQVEKEIFVRLTTIEDTKPAFGARPPQAGSMGAGANPFGAGAPVGPPRPPAAPSSGSSFLDDWLSKRGTPAPAGTMPQAPSAAMSPTGMPSSTSPSYQLPPTPSPFPSAAPPPAQPAPAISSQSALTSNAPAAFPPGWPAAPPSDPIPVAPPPQDEGQLVVQRSPEPAPLEPTMPDSQNNISSNQLQQAEVSSIAASIKDSIEPKTEEIKPEPAPEEHHQEEPHKKAHHKKTKAPKAIHETKEEVKPEVKPLASSFEELSKLSSDAEGAAKAEEPKTSPDAITIDEQGNMHYKEGDDQLPPAPAGS